MTRGLSHDSSKTGMLPLEAVETTSRRFIRTALSQLVDLGSNEELVFLGSSLTEDGSGDPYGNESEYLIVANTAHFCRLVDGVPIIGHGNTITVTMTADLQVTGFSVDWPMYQRVSEERVAQHDAIQQRLLESTGVNVVNQKRGSAQTREITVFACGVLDPGPAMAPAGSVVYPGCLARVVDQDEGTTDALEVFIPAGETATQAPWFVH
jgi:hypothetical protein